MEPLPSSPLVPPSPADMQAHLCHDLLRIEAWLAGYSQWTDIPLGIWLMVAAQLLTSARTALAPGKVVAAEPMPLSKPPVLPLLRLRLKGYEQELKQAAQNARNRRASIWLENAALWLAHAQEFIDTVIRCQTSYLD